MLLSVTCCELTVVFAVFFVHRPAPSAAFGVDCIAAAGVESDTEVLLVDAATPSAAEHASVQLHSAASRCVLSASRGAVLSLSTITRHKAGQDPAACIRDTHTHACTLRLSLLVLPSAWRGFTHFPPGFC